MKKNAATITTTLDFMTIQDRVPESKKYLQDNYKDIGIYPVHMEGLQQYINNIPISNMNVYERDTKEGKQYYVYYNDPGEKGFSGVYEIEPEEADDTDSSLEFVSRHDRLPDPTEYYLEVNYILLPNGTYKVHMGSLGQEHDVIHDMNVYVTHHYESHTDTLKEKKYYVYYTDKISKNDKDELTNEYTGVYEVKAMGRESFLVAKGLPIEIILSYPDLSGNPFLSKVGWNRIVMNGPRDSYGNLVIDHGYQWMDLYTPKDQMPLDYDGDPKSLTYSGDPSKAEKYYVYYTDEISKNDKDELTGQWTGVYEVTVVDDWITQRAASYIEANGLPIIQSELPIIQPDLNNPEHFKLIGNTIVHIDGPGFVIDHGDINMDVYKGISSEYEYTNYLGYYYVHYTDNKSGNARPPAVSDKYGEAGLWTGVYRVRRDDARESIPASSPWLDEEEVDVEDGPPSIENDDGKRAYDAFAEGLKLENPPNLGDSNFFESIGNTTVHMDGSGFVIDHGGITMEVYKGKKPGTDYQDKYYVYYEDKIEGLWTGVYEIEPEWLDEDEWLDEQDDQEDDVEDGQEDDVEDGQEDDVEDGPPSGSIENDEGSYAYEAYASGKKLENPPNLSDSNFFQSIGYTTVHMDGSGFVIDHGPITMEVFKGKTGNYKDKYYVYYEDKIEGLWTGVYEIEPNWLIQVNDLGPVTIDLGIITGKIFDSYPLEGRQDALDLQINPKGDYDLVKFSLTQDATSDNFIIVSNTEDDTPNPNPMLNLKIELYQKLNEGGYSFIAESDYDDVWEGFNFAEMPAGEYYLKVYHNSDDDVTGSYRVCYNMLRFNDYIDLAVITGKVSYDVKETKPEGDYEIFMFELTSETIPGNSFAVYNREGSSAVDLAIGLYHLEGFEIWYEDNPGYKKEEIYFTAEDVIPPGIYFLKVYHNNNTGTDWSYILSYNFSLCERIGTGDVNGDYATNDLDVTQILPHILNSTDPDECFTVTADVNNDGSVDVLDIVQITRAILQPTTYTFNRDVPKSGEISLSLTITGNTIDVNYTSDTPIFGVQFNLDGGAITNTSAGTTESNNFTVTFSSTTVIGFSYNGRSIPAGEGILTTITYDNMYFCPSEINTYTPDFPDIESLEKDEFQQLGDNTVDIETDEFRVVIPSSSSLPILNNSVPEYLVARQGSIKNIIKCSNPSELISFEDFFKNNNKEYLALYIGAAWCGPCVDFVKKLTPWYNNSSWIKENLDILFLSADFNQDDFNDYIAGKTTRFYRGDGIPMPWHAIPYGSLDNVEDKGWRSEGFDVTGAFFEHILFKDKSSISDDKELEFYNYLVDNKMPSAGLPTLILLKRNYYDPNANNFSARIVANLGVGDDLALIYGDYHTRSILSMGDNPNDWNKLSTYDEINGYSSSGQTAPPQIDLDPKILQNVELYQSLGKNTVDMSVLTQTRYDNYDNVVYFNNPDNLGIGWYHWGQWDSNGEGISTDEDNILYIKNHYKGFPGTLALLSGTDIPTTPELTLNYFYYSTPSGENKKPWSQVPLGNIKTKEDLEKFFKNNGIDYAYGEFKIQIEYIFALDAEGRENSYSIEKDELGFPIIRVQTIVGLHPVWGDQGQVINLSRYTLHRLHNDYLNYLTPPVKNNLEVYKDMNNQDDYYVQFEDAVYKVQKDIKNIQRVNLPVYMNNQDDYYVPFENSVRKCFLAKPNLSNIIISGSNGSRIPVLQDEVLDEDDNGNDNPIELSCEQEFEQYIQNFNKLEYKNNKFVWKNENGDTISLDKYTKTVFNRKGVAISDKAWERIKTLCYNDNTNNTNDNTNDKY